MPFWLKVLAESVEAYLTEGDHKLEAAEAENSSESIGESAPEANPGV